MREHPQEMDAQRYATSKQRAIVKIFKTNFILVLWILDMKREEKVRETGYAYGYRRKYCCGIRWSLCRDSVWYWGFSNANHLVAQ